ncbi:cyclopropane-fatty-acyl-phospholipid synthase family protein [Shewanella sp. SR44-3]|uniref:SAM-dependent methyltransferase n=1 Tax=unclassified Shewanella TaxID=196818 RepID=UPI0015F8B1FD|nr:cyclopropane-fatty-acyl-phospholipid synthase family protein [Shewanella sp. SR44-3]MBB1269314.1 class I SAM-dependent methyltransferase [Shewanella sp. SR44-3]
MEEFAKSTTKLDRQASYSSVETKNNYRSLVLSLLNKIQGASIELIEGAAHSVHGQRDAPLTGQLVVHDASFYRDLITAGSIGAAEAFLDGKWTSPNLTRLVQVMAINQAQLDALESKMQWLAKLKNLLLKRKNINTEQGSKRNILAHYDIGNELYERFLDNSMLYSCAIYSEQAQSLGQAQQNKMRVICERLELTQGQHVLEIGTGWGGLAIFMAQEYGCHVTTTTISEAQFSFAQQQVIALGLSDKITLLKQDYRKLTGQYDKLVSIEMIEAVGHEYMASFFEICSQRLKADGKMLIQAITIADGRYEKYRKGVDFIQKYIFPGGCLPSIAVMTAQLAQRTDLVIDEVQDIGLHYARTLNDWRLAFEHSWDELKGLGYSEEFKRLWLFYFSYCEGAFLERVISTHHLVARKPRFVGRGDAAIINY